MSITASPAGGASAAAASPASPAMSASPVWRALVEARTADQFIRAWIAVLCRDVVAARSGLVLMAQPDGSFAPAGSEPAGADLRYLAEVATDALRRREGVTRREADGTTRLAYPLELPDRLAGAIVIDLGMIEDDAAERAARLVHWGAGWLLDLLRQRELGLLQARLHQGGFLVDTLLALMAERGPRAANNALVNRLAREFGCAQAILGIARGRTLKIAAVSNTAWFDERTTILNDAIQAMHEAYDQRRRIDWSAADTVTTPPADPQPNHAQPVLSAHRRYAAQSGAKALCSLPLTGTSGIDGVLMLERDRPFDDDELRHLETLGLALAPLLTLQRDADQGAARRLARTARRWLGWLTDSSHPAIKAGAAVAAIVLALLALVPAPFRISAQAVVEGSVQRAVVAPFDGFLREAPVRAGDTVKAGQSMARLDDRDLRLERTRWEAELEVAQRKELEAMAKANRVEQRLAAAQANQARAQLDLTLSRLERASIAAPFDGIVVKGDLSQQLGSPVETGKSLFEVAPLDGWRVILKVDEADIGHVRVGATGELVLASLPGTRWPFRVRKLTPIALAEEGRNLFRVEAELESKAAALSPNMEGVGKVDAGRRSLLWTWTRPLAAWMRKTWWRVMP
jgi:biotin carboxyl carrier protein